jgi:hypothetical protein
MLVLCGRFEWYAVLVSTFNSKKNASVGATIVRKLVIILKQDESARFHTYIYMSTFLYIQDYVSTHDWDDADGCFL